MQEQRRSVEFACGGRLASSRLPVGVVVGVGVGVGVDVVVGIGGMPWMAVEASRVDPFRVRRFYFKTCAVRSVM